MAKKITKKNTTKTKPSTKKKAKKDSIQQTQESSSLVVMVLAIVGILLLIYFGSSTEVSVDVRMGEEPSEEIIEDNSIYISGKKYSSKEAAFEALKLNPQTSLTAEEIGFVESYK